MLREFQEEINNLKNQLAQFQGGPGPVIRGVAGEKIIKVEDEK